MINDEYVLDKQQQAKRRKAYLFPAARGYPPLTLNSLSDSPALIFCGFQILFNKNSPTFLPKTLDKPAKKCGASRLLIKKALFIPAQPVSIF
ncbi:hypothetical protein D7V86_04145 [bacterium D16-51]|nr:hypothetical protein D7V96_19015 [bacterium D16-59]RKI61720.1 hypothetical protein D7V86_04145 [bacterium D16-51]